MVEKDLLLEKNRLERLPETIGGLTVGRHLDLQENQLATLPASLGSIRVPNEQRDEASGRPRLLKLEGNPLQEGALEGIEWQRSPD